MYALDVTVEKPRRINAAIPRRRSGHELRTQGESAIFDVRSGMEVSYTDMDGMQLSFVVEMKHFPSAAMQAKHKGKRVHFGIWVLVNVSADKVRQRQRWKPDRLVVKVG